jgi:hypothetical protein
LIMMVSSSSVFVNVFTAVESHAPQGREKLRELQAAAGTVSARASKYTSSGVA